MSHGRTAGRRRQWQRRQQQQPPPPHPPAAAPTVGQHKVRHQASVQVRAEAIEKAGNMDISNSNVTAIILLLLYYYSIAIIVIM